MNINIKDVVSDDEEVEDIGVHEKDIPKALPSIATGAFVFFNTHGVFLIELHDDSFPECPPYGGI